MIMKNTYVDNMNREMTVLDSFKGAIFQIKKQNKLVNLFLDWDQVNSCFNESGLFVNATIKILEGRQMKIHKNIPVYVITENNLFKITATIDRNDITLFELGERLNVFYPDINDLRVEYIMNEWDF